MQSFESVNINRRQFIASAASAVEIRKSMDFDPETGDFEWHKVLMDIKRRNPQIDNVYCELGSSFGLLALLDPRQP